MPVTTSAEAASGRSGFVVVRARRIQGGDADTVIKLRPVDPSTIERPAPTDLEPELHLRAAKWHAEHGPTEVAVEHAIAAGDRTWAATMLVRAAGTL